MVFRPIFFPPDVCGDHTGTEHAEPIRNNARGSPHAPHKYKQLKELILHRKAFSMKTVHPVPGSQRNYGF